MEVIQFRPQGVCSQLIQIAIEDDIIRDMGFLGGCNGNLQGISALCRGMKIADVIERLQGINCGGKGTSCPDQLAKCLIEYSKNKKEAKLKG